MYKIKRILHIKGKENIIMNWKKSSWRSAMRNFMGIFSSALIVVAIVFVLLFVMGDESSFFNVKGLCAAIGALLLIVILRMAGLKK